MKPQKLKYVDKTHAYYLDGKRAKSVTTVAKVPEDGYALELWGKRMVAIGMASAPHLVEAAAAHFDDRDKLNEIVEEAETLARTHHAATRGTAMHRVTERADRNEPMLLTDLLAATVDAWRTALDVAGYEVLPEFIERAVVYPEQRICGRFDRIVRHRETGVLRILDLKSGERALRYPHSIAVQLALYANAPWLAGTWEGESGETEDFEQLPDELDREIGLVLHMPEPGKVALGEVNIAAGWAIARDAVFPILEWRNRDDLVTVIDLALPSSTPDDPFDGVSGNGPLIAGMSPQKPTAVPSPAAGPAGPSAAGEGTASPAPAALPRVEWIAERIAQLPPAGLQLLTVRWPADVVRPPKAQRASGMDYDDDERAAIEAVLMPIEREHECPFVPNPTLTPDGWATQAEEQIAAAGEAKPESLPGGGSVDGDHSGRTSPAAAPDEGSQVTDEDIAAVANAFDTLPADAALFARVLLKEMADAGSPLSLTKVRSRRRLSIARAVLGLAHFDDEIARACLAVVLGEEVPESVTTGVALSALTIDEADRLADMAQALDAGSLHAVYADDGALEIRAA